MKCPNLLTIKQYKGNPYFPDMLGRLLPMYQEVLSTGLACSLHVDDVQQKLQSNVIPVVGLEGESSMLARHSVLPAVCFHHLSSQTFSFTHPFVKTLDPSAACCTVVIQNCESGAHTVADWVIQDGSSHVRHMKAIDDGAGVVGALVEGTVVGVGVVGVGVVGVGVVVVGVVGVAVVVEGVVVGVGVVGFVVAVVDGVDVVVVEVGTVVGLCVVGGAVLGALVGCVVGRAVDGLVGTCVTAWVNFCVATIGALLGVVFSSLDLSFTSVL